MFVVPLGFCTRDQNNSRKSSSVKMPNAFRSLLFGGIEPETIVGLGLSSAVPWPNASSPLPDGESFLASTPERKALSVPPANQSIHPVVLTIRFALVSISNALPSGDEPSVLGLLQVVVCATADPEIANATAATAASKRGNDRKSRRRRRGPVGPKIRVLIDALPLNFRTKAGRPPKATPGETLVLPHHLL